MWKMSVCSLGMFKTFHLIHSPRMIWRSMNLVCVEWAIIAGASTTIIARTDHSISQRRKRYDEEIRRLDQGRDKDSFNFCNFFIVKGGFLYIASRYVASLLISNATL